VHHPQKANASNDTLSRHPIATAPPDSVVDDTVQIAELELSSLVITDLLDAESITVRMPHTINLASQKAKERPFCKPDDIVSY